MQGGDGTSGPVFCFQGMGTPRKLAISVTQPESPSEPHQSFPGSLRAWSWITITAGCSSALPREVPEIDANRKA